MTSHYCTNLTYLMIVGLMMGITLTVDHLNELSIEGTNYVTEKKESSEIYCSEVTGFMCAQSKLKLPYRTFY